MRRGTVALFAAGFLQGASFVLVPALGTILRSAPYGMGNTTYGILYFPEIAGAVLAALSAGALYRRVGSGGLFRLGASSNAVAMVLLVLVSFSGSLAFFLLLGETLMLGIGFGLTNAAINRGASLLFPGSAAAAVTLLNAVIGGATAVSPMILDGLQVWLSWALWPAALLLGWLVLLAVPQAMEAVRSELGGLRAWKLSMLPFALAVLVYAICEGSFGSWANVLVSVDHHLPAADGGLALSLFWGGMTAARFVLGALPGSWVPRRPIYLAAPGVMAVCFLLLPHFYGAVALLALFAAAGAACGIFYPYSMAYGVASHGAEGTQMAGLLVGALMVGEGIGSTGLGLLQQYVSLNRIYTFSALWALPLIWLAWRNSHSSQAGRQV